MTEAEFLDFIRKAARRATDTIGRIGNLVCTQSEGTGEPTLREPEMRTALQQQAEEDRLLYGIEVPTLYPYRFSGEGEGGRRALTDFALLDSNQPNAVRNVLIELKEGQAHRVGEVGVAEDYPTISKDLHKLLAEPSVHGACMLHICQAADARTIEALKNKYTVAMQIAALIAPQTILGNDKISRAHRVEDQAWFLLIILVIHSRDKSDKRPYLLKGMWDEPKREWLIEKDQEFSIQP